MNKKTKAGSSIAEVTTKVVELLEPHSSEERQKVIRASLTLLGESSINESQGKEIPVSAPVHGPGADKHDQNPAGLLPKAANWMKQNSLTMAQIEQVFHIANGAVSVIAQSVPGKSDKERTHNAYVLQGVGGLLATGEAAFDDKAARKLCQELGCQTRLTTQLI